MRNLRARDQVTSIYRIRMKTQSLKTKCLLVLNMAFYCKRERRSLLMIVKFIGVK